MKLKPLLKKIITFIITILIESCSHSFAIWIQHAMCFFDLQEYHPTFPNEAQYYDLNIKTNIFS
jgi:hypothetical protein